MFRLVSNKKLKRIWQKGYDAGLAKGYELGFMMGKTERTNRGFIIGGSKVDQQIEQILKGKAI